LNVLKFSQPVHRAILAAGCSFESRSKACSHSAPGWIGEP
jgi:hypothetical protein